MLQFRELQSDLKPWLPWSHHPQSGSANPQENSLSTATCPPMNERRKTEDKKDTTLFLIVKMSVTLPQGHTEKPSAWDFPGRRRSHTSWGRAEGKVRLSHIFWKRSIPQALPGPTLWMVTRCLTLNQSKWLNSSSQSFFLPPPFSQ